MFISIRKYRVTRGSAPQLARRVQDGFVPLVRKIQGFKGYYLLDGGPDVLITVSMFDTADEALTSNETAAEWVRDNVMEFTKGLPEVMVGDVLVTEAVSDRDQHTVFAFCKYSVKSVEHRRIWLLPAFVVLVERRQYEFAVNVLRSPDDAAGRVAESGQRR